MIATLLSLLFAWMFVGSVGAEIADSFRLLLFVGAPVLGVVLLVLSLAQRVGMLKSVQSAQRHAMPRLIEILQQDRRLIAAQMFLLIFCLGSFLFPLAVMLKITGLHLCWIIGLGIALDCLWYVQKRVENYLDPSFAIQMLTKKVKKGAGSLKFRLVRKGFDGLSEVTLLAIRQGHVIEAEHALDAMEDVVCSDIIGIGKKGMPLQDDWSKRLNYSLGYFMDPYRTLFLGALEEGLESVASRIVLSLGNICHTVCQCDPSAAVLPLHTLGGFAAYSQDEGYDDVMVKASLTLQELARIVAQAEEVKNVGAALFFQKIVSHLHHLAEEEYKKDKSISLDLITAPFRGLKESLEGLGSEERHPESDQMVAAVDQVLGEFEALELVLQKMPGLPPKEESADVK